MAENLRVLLVNPPRVKGLPVVREERYEHRDVGSVYPPLSILQGAASLRKTGYDVQVLDCNGFDLRLEEVGRALSSWQPHLVVARMAFDCQEEDLKVLQIAKAAVPKCVTAIRNKIISEVPWLLEEITRRPEVDLYIMSELDVVLPALAQVMQSALSEKGELPPIPPNGFPGFRASPTRARTDSPRPFRRRSWKWRMLPSPPTTFCLRWNPTTPAFSPTISP